MTRQDKTMLFLNVTYLKRRAIGLNFFCPRSQENKAGSAWTGTSYCSVQCAKLNLTEILFIAGYYIYPHTNQKSGCCFDYHYFYFLQRLSQKARSSQTSERESEFIFHCGDTICVCDLLVSNVISMENVICHKNNTLQNSNFKLKESLRYIIFLSLLSGIKQESRWILLQDDQQQNQGKETYIFLLFHFECS